MAQDYRHNHTESPQCTQPFKRLCSSDSISLINYHFVWIPRRRRKVLKGKIVERLQQLIYEVATELGCKVLALEIMDDHVHLFLNCPPALAPKDIMFRVKGRSARFLRKEFPDPLMKMPSMWTRSYFVSTAGNVSSETIQMYIENQKTI